jgi:pimeloyl-ACP methyl ester carboxylesterase
VLYTAGDPRVGVLVTWAAVSTVQRWPEATRAAWRRSGVNPVENARTRQVLPLYTDVLDDIERNAAVLDIEAAAGRIEVPWLIVHGTADEAVPVAEGRLLAASAAPDTTKFVAIEGAGHTFGAAHPWKGATPELDLAVDTTLAFFAAELR